MKSPLLIIDNFDKALQSIGIKLNIKQIIYLWHLVDYIINNSDASIFILDKYYVPYSLTVSSKYRLLDVRSKSQISNYLHKLTSLNLIESVPQKGKTYIRTGDKYKEVLSIIELVKDGKKYKVDVVNSTYNEIKIHTVYKTLIQDLSIVNNPKNYTIDRVIIMVLNNLKSKGKFQLLSRILNNPNSIRPLFIKWINNRYFVQSFNAVQHKQEYLTIDNTARNNNNVVL